MTDAPKAAPDPVNSSHDKQHVVSAVACAIDRIQTHVASLESINAGQRATIERLRRDLAISEERRLATGAQLLKAEETLRAVGPSVMSIAAERMAQITREAEHKAGDLARAAANYAWAAADTDKRRSLRTPYLLWPWAARDWKPSTRVRDLVKAGALIVAELDRLTGYRAKRRSTALGAPVPARSAAPCRPERSADALTERGAQ